MSDETERLLRRPTPRAAPPELRARVLDALTDELNSNRPRWRTSPSLAAAAAVLAALASNYFVGEAVDRRLAAAFGPIPVRRQAAEIAADIASMTDPETGRWAYQRLSAAEGTVETVDQYAERLHRMIQVYAFDPKGADDETPPKNPQMDRDLRGSRDRRPLDAQRVLRLEVRNTA